MDSYHHNDYILFWRSEAVCLSISVGWEAGAVFLLPSCLVCGSGGVLWEKNAGLYQLLVCSDRVSTVSTPKKSRKETEHLQLQKTLSMHPVKSIYTGI